MRPFWWWQEREYGLCRLTMRGKQKEVCGLFLRPMPGVQGRGFSDIKEPQKHPKVR